MVNILVGALGGFFIIPTFCGLTIFFFTRTSQNEEIMRNSPFIAVIVAVVIMGLVAVGGVIGGGGKNGSS